MKYKKNCNLFRIERLQILEDYLHISFICNIRENKDYVRKGEKQKSDSDSWCLHRPFSTDSSPCVLALEKILGTA